MRKKPQIKAFTGIKNRKADHLRSEVAYKVYDCSIEDVEERKAKAVVYPNAIKMGRAIGIKPKTSIIRLYTDPLIQKRFYSPLLKKEFAIRRHSEKPKRTFGK